MSTPETGCPQQPRFSVMRVTIHASPHSFHKSLITPKKVARFVTRGVQKLTKYVEKVVKLATLGESAILPLTSQKYGRGYRGAQFGRKTNFSAFFVTLELCCELNWANQSIIICIPYAIVFCMY